MANPLPSLGLFEKGCVQLAKPTGPCWTLSATGDIRPKADICAALDAPGYPLDAIRELLDSDIVVGNLEAPVIANRKTLLEGLKHYPPFIRPYISHLTPRRLADLKAMGFTHFNLANNHVCDFGQDGISETLDQIKAHGFGHFGAGSSLRGARHYKIVRCGGVRVAFGGHTQDENLFTTPGPNANTLTPEHVIRSVEKAKERADVVVVSLHAGYEFGDVPRLEFFRLCRELVKRGADVILGSPPHVPHGMELYRGGLIFYSLGNFLFRMKGIGGVNWTTRSFVPKLTFSGKRLCRVEIAPTHLDGKSVLRRSKGRMARSILQHLESLTALLNERAIDASNREFIPEHVLKVTFGLVYNAGQRGDRKLLDWLIERRFSSDPFLWCLKDVARLRRSGTAFEDF